MAQLELSLLGSFRVSLNGVAVTTFASDKASALLTYLMMEPDRPHRRAQLAGLLWPDTSETDARHSLRQTLYRLRKTIGDQHAPAPFVKVDRRQVQFDAASDYWLDVNEFDALVAACRSHHAWSRLLCAECRQRLERALALYQGEFLAGFSLPDSPQFEAWQLTQQESYHRQAIEVYFQLGEHYETEGAYGRAAKCARRVIELEPWRESAHRRLMRALALEGRQAEALRQYEFCKNSLKQELGVPPSPQTEQLKAQIHAGELKSTVFLMDSDAFQVPSLDVNRGLAAGMGSSFAAREAELVSLHRHVDQMISGRGGVVFVRGEAGSGKTMLLAEFARQAALSHGGVVVAAGNCSSLAGQGDLCQPFREVLSTLTSNFESCMGQGVLNSAHRQRLWASFPTVLSALLDLAPDLLGAWIPIAPLVRRAHMVSGLDHRLRERLNLLSGPASAVQNASHVGRTGASRDLQAGGGLPPPSQAARLEQVNRVVFAVASEQPLLILLDDLQWADATSCNLLFHLGRQLVGKNVLIIGAYRSEDLIQGEGRHPLQPVIRELQAQSGDTLIDLAEADHKAFVDAYLDSASKGLDNTFSDTLFDRTEGHPLFTVELLRNLQSEKGLVRDEEGKWKATAKMDWKNVPPRVEAVIGERIERVPLADQRLLSAACVQGDDFCAEVLAEVLGESTLDVTRILSEVLDNQYHLVQYRSVRQSEGLCASRFRFRHHLFRQHLYQGLNPATRAKLHRATAEVLQEWRNALSGKDSLRDMSAARLAWHFEQAGMAQKAVPYLLEAGEEAYLLSASEQAIIHLNRGLELLAEYPHTQERDRLEYSLQAALGQPLLSVHGYAAEQQAYVRAAELAQQLGEPDLLVPLMSLQFHHHHVRGGYTEAQEITQRLFSVSEETQAPYHQLQANYQQSMICFFTGRLQVARRHIDIVLSLLENLPDDHPVLHSGNMGRLNAANLAASVLWHQGYPDQARDYAHLAVTEGDKLGHAYWSALAKTLGLCHVHLLRREGQRAEEIATSALRIAHDGHFQTIEMAARIYRSCAQIEMGNPYQALATLEEDLALYQASEHRFFFTLYLAYQAKACHLIGEIERGLDVIALALDFVDKGDRLYEAELHRIHGDLLLSSNGEDQSETAYQNTVRVAGEQEAHGLHLRASVSLARLWQVQGRLPEAYRMLALSYDWFTEGFDTVDLKEARTLQEELSISEVNSVP